MLSSPGDEQLAYRLADAFFQQGDFDQALLYANRIKHDRHLCRKVRLLQGWIDFHQGRFEGGWPPYPGNADFEPGRYLEQFDPRVASAPVRVKRPNHPVELEADLGLQHWNPNVDLHGRPLLVWFNFNSSFGGEVLCSRLVNAFQQKFDLELILAVDPRHRQFIAACFPRCLVLSKSEELSAIRTRCRAYILARDMAQYVIRSEADFIPIARETYALSSSQPMPSGDRGSGSPSVAISWKTTNTDQGRYRNISLESLARVLAKHKVIYHAAQHGDIRADQQILDRWLDHQIRYDTIDPRADSHEIALRLLQMDAVITVDNSLLHLAGAVGIPTMAMISIPAYWAWPDRGTKSRWYDSVHLIRQERPAHWEPVLREIDVSLATLTASSGRHVA